MGINNLTKVFSLDLIIVLIIATLILSSPPCPPNVQYWNSHLQQCVNCTKCDELEPKKVFVVLRPCEVHRDTKCAPISNLFQQIRHHHYVIVTSSPAPPPTTTISEINEAENNIQLREDDDLTVTLWDWQIIILGMAVVACILFFMVAAVYSIFHARQWKRLKENFEADVEELSAKLNLMTTDEHGSMEPNFNGPITDGNYHNNRCVYLEQLLVRKETTNTDIKRGVANVYIEEKN